jgi:cytochrome c
MKLMFQKLNSTHAVASVAAIAALMAAGSSAQASDKRNGLAVARSYACMGCHMVDHKLVGPSFRQIAAKYKGDAQAPAKLAIKVRDGSSGVWGVIPMPSHPDMSSADIKTVVGWVLAGAPSK